MYGTVRRLDWEEFLQERATTTLRCCNSEFFGSPGSGPGSGRGFQPRSPGRGPGGGRGSIRNRLSSSPTVLPTRSSRPQLIPDILRTTVNEVWTPEATGVIESMVQDTCALLAGCFQQLTQVQLSYLGKNKFPLGTCISKLSTSSGSPFRILYVSTGQ